MENFEKGAAVLVNGEHAGEVIEAEEMAAIVFGGRKFWRYLVKFEDGAIEGFTGAYLTAAG